ncbi:hypothetical protein ABL78_6778 [Leptomonas seymouri]|uniref:Centrosomal protein POC5 n=1 Tax=Leptomonas seymouri TaxID=5684 RepID=A0A0N1I2V9_LEPSE|nr:hypothetical protein ABL78_6778 [Leptomonas seymouri]|eukprot:KPI84172.1 hypothetical protein ABL78_6778 [Leptomonas seymouri]
MPLVKAEDDGSFIVELADEVRASCERMNKHTCDMVEEYLHRRLEQVRGELERECSLQIEEMKQRVAAVEAEKSAEVKQHASAKRQLSNAAEALRQRSTRMHLLCRFLRWRRDVEGCRERRRLAEEANRHRERLAVFHMYSQWRLFAAARRSAHLEAVELRKRDLREQELLEQVNGHRKFLQEEKEKNAALSEELKEAFVRGMCSLNREAVQVLHGADGNQDDDVEAIAEILCRDNPSRRLSISQNKMEDSTQFSAYQQPSICPVHQVDCNGHVYHRCFAPGYCAYDDHHQRSRTPPSSSFSHGPPSPFVVRADPRSVRNFNATSSVPVQHAAKPLQARWKL